MRIVWGDGAKRDLQSALDFVRGDSPARADRLADRIFRVIELLERFPELAPESPHHRGLRQLFVPKTPYLVIYRIHEAQVEIRAVIHAKQRRRR